MDTKATILKTLARTTHAATTPTYLLAPIMAGCHCRSDVSLIARGHDIEKEFKERNLSCNEPSLVCQTRGQEMTKSRQSGAFS